MPRKHRLEFPGAIYHINHRGNHHEYVYRDDDDRKLFLKLLKTTIGGSRNSLGPVPRTQRILSRPELKELFDGNGHGDRETRNRIIHDAFKLYAYTQSEIAAFLNLSRSAITKIICSTN